MAAFVYVRAVALFLAVAVASCGVAATPVLSEGVQGVQGVQDAAPVPEPAQSLDDAVAAGAEDAAEAAKAQKLMEQVRSVLEHFKQSDPTGFPGAEVPDPMDVPPMNTSFAIATMNFENVTVHGLSRFRFHEARVNFTAMKAEVAARIDAVLILGNYTLCTWFSCSAGGFTVTLDGVLVSGVAGLEVGPGGRLRAEEIGMDVTFDGIAMDFKNLGLMMSMFQGIINKVGSFLFDNVKPFILSEVNTKIRAEVDKQVAGVDVRFPSSMAPIDMMVADARHAVRTMGYDPYRLPDVTKKMGPLQATLSHLFATGLSSFYRRGNVTVWMKEHVLHAGIHLATKRLRGTCRWLVHSPDAPSVLQRLMRRSGDASFTVDYLEVKAVFNQSLDTRKHPYLESLDVTLGPMTLVSRGDAGKLNALTEFGVNVLPNLIRYQVVDALEEPLRQRVQKELDNVNVEDLINEKLQEALKAAPASTTATSVTTPEPVETTAS
ncbi:uncharacterized protein LOC117647292 [Thrips palmi]|uniref:Uncharacterized protein LOC117647292 n=1 Tax=Thrips palmi TaxID=161013 RepID=A0A6P8YXK5_THRPL|nr:uncharacterized protein LOC117647292 [Thrips palmi]